jgi:hypothetical protein
MAGKSEGDTLEALAKARANLQQQRKQWQAAADNEWHSIAATGKKNERPDTRDGHSAHGTFPCLQ